MPQLIDYPCYAWQLVGGKRSYGERSQHKRLVLDLAPYMDVSSPRDILDLANGRLRPQRMINQRGLLVGDVGSLPCANASFDLVVSGAAFDHCASREGEEFLTPAIAGELSGYSRDELTCATSILMARRR